MLDILANPGLADATLSYLFGLTADVPDAYAIGINPERMKQYFNGFLARHKLTVRQLPAPKASAPAKPAARKAAGITKAGGTPAKALEVARDARLRELERQEALKRLTPREQQSVKRTAAKEHSRIEYALDEAVKFGASPAHANRVIQEGTPRAEVPARLKELRDARYAAEWECTPALRAEFLSKENYLAYRRAEAEGLVKTA